LLFNERFQDNVQTGLKRYEVANWIHLTQKNIQWRVLVNMGMKLLGYIKGEEVLTEQLLPSQGGHRSVQVQGRVLTNYYVLVLRDVLRPRHSSSG
jgi:hypothetical protein